jgi:ribonuclease HI
LRYEEYFKEVSGGEPATTNNRMEIYAAIGALLALTEPCEIDLFTDSAYLKNGITEWLPGWKRRGWLTAEKKPVKNEDLWRELDRLTSSHKINWRWLKGHAGQRDNERCDQLAVQATAAIRKKFSKAQLDELKKQFEATRSASTSSALL